MKAPYEKPLLAVELFSLTQSIARDCTAGNIPAENLNLNDPNTCGWDLGGGLGKDIVFVLGLACTIDGENMFHVCYNNPAETTIIFRS